MSVVRVTISGNQSTRRKLAEICETVHAAIMRTVLAYTYFLVMAENNEYFPIDHLSC